MSEHLIALFSCVRKSFGWCFAIAGGMWLSAAAAALPPTKTAATVTGGTLANVIDHRTGGWAFAVNVPIRVEEVGWYDDDDDGLSMAHEVGIWHDASQTLLSTTVIPAGLNPPLAASFRYAPLTSPLVLSPGTYVIAGVIVAPPDRIRDDALVSTVPEITYLRNRANDTFSLSMLFPGDTFPDQENGPGEFGMREAGVAEAMLLGGDRDDLRSRRRRVHGIRAECELSTVV